MNVISIKRGAILRIVGLITAHVNCITVDRLLHDTC
jgi:hypothetical protein